jgi:hypothetical protein
MKTGCYPITNILTCLKQKLKFSTYEPEFWGTTWLSNKLLWNKWSGTVFSLIPPELRLSKPELIPSDKFIPGWGPTGVVSKTTGLQVKHPWQWGSLGACMDPWYAMPASGNPAICWHSALGSTLDWKSTRYSGSFPFALWDREVSGQGSFCLGKVSGGGIEGGSFSTAHKWLLFWETISPCDIWGKLRPKPLTTLAEYTSVTGIP